MVVPFAEVRKMETDFLRKRQEGNVLPPDIEAVEHTVRGLIHLTLQSNESFPRISEQEISELDDFRNLNHYHNLVTLLRRSGLEPDINMLQNCLSGIQDFVKKSVAKRIVATGDMINGIYQAVQSDFPSQIDVNFVRNFIAEGQNERYCLDEIFADDRKLAIVLTIVNRFFRKGERR